MVSSPVICPLCKTKLPDRRSLGGHKGKKACLATRRVRELEDAGFRLLVRQVDKVQRYGFKVFQDIDGYGRGSKGIYLTQGDWVEPWLAHSTGYIVRFLNQGMQEGPKALGGEFYGYWWRIEEKLFRFFFVKMKRLMKQSPEDFRLLCTTIEIMDFEYFKDLFLSPIWKKVHLEVHEDIKLARERAKLEKEMWDMRAAERAQLRDRRERMFKKKRTRKPRGVAQAG